jgi:small nuclear ribonucleoprotein
LRKVLPDLRLLLDSPYRMLQRKLAIPVQLAQQQQPKKPLISLQRAVNRQVSVRLKMMELEYRGKMINVDPYMNVILVDATEYSGGNPAANYGKVVIRGNNVLFIKIANEFQM